MTLRSRLALGLVIIAAVLVVPLVVARTSMQRLHGQVRSLREGEFQASLVLGRLRDALGDVRAREVALGVVKSDTVHAQLREALERAELLADSLDAFQLDSATRRIHRDLATVRPATEEEFAAMRAGRGDRADSISRQTVGPALRDADLALSPVEQLLRARTTDRVLAAESALGTRRTDLPRRAGRGAHPRRRHRPLAHPVHQPAGHGARGGDARRRRRRARPYIGGWRPTATTSSGGSRSASGR